MRQFKEFPFEKARRATASEVEKHRLALEKKLGQKRHPRGRPPKKAGDKYLPVSIRLHPLVLRWAKNEAKRRGLKYQSIINEALLKFAA